jgi:hypothetical protein
MTDLDNILATMLSEVRNKPALSRKKKRQAKKAAGRNRNTSANQKVSQIFEKKPIPASEWASEKLVMYQQIGTCCCCDTEYTMPNKWLFIKRWHPKQGYHYERVNHTLDLEASAISFEREIIYEHITLQACPTCFMIEENLIKASKSICSGKQLDLFN